MSESQSVVLAGSKRFVQEAAGPVAREIGAWPDVAEAPAQAFALCERGARLLVVEQQGEGWMRLVRDLRDLHGATLPIVAVLPAGQAAAGGADEVVAWDGRPGPLLEAVRRFVASGRPAAGPAGSPPADLLFDIDEQRPPLATAAAGGGEARLAAAPSPWPGGVPSAQDGESILSGAVAGLRPDGEALEGATDQVLEALSDLEKGALRGEDVPVEPGPVRRAASLRWRVLVALGTAPAPGSPVDLDAVQGMLAEIDAVLAEMKRLSESAVPAALEPLDALRTALVREAIDLTEAVQRIAPAASPEAAPAQVRRPAARLLSIHGPAPAREAPRLHRGWVALLAAAALAAAAYHGQRLLSAVRPQPPPTLPGAPAETFAVRSDGRTLLFQVPGRAVDRAEMERFRTQEEARGNAVREIGPGTWTVEPQPAVGQTGGGRP